MDVNLAIGQLNLAVRALPPVAALPRIQAAVTWLSERAEKTDPANVSQEYVRSLQQAAELLRTDRRSVVADDVADELEAKVEHCRALGIDMGGSVLLSVNTRRGAQTVRDWQVFYLLKIYEHVKGAAPTVFPSLSTPTQSALEPGRYWLWARDPQPDVPASALSSASPDNPTPGRPARPMRPAWWHALVALTAAVVAAFWPLTPALRRATRCRRVRRRRYRCHCMRPARHPPRGAPGNLDRSVDRIGRGRRRPADPAFQCGCGLRCGLRRATRSHWSRIRSGRGFYIAPIQVSRRQTACSTRAVSRSGSGPQLHTVVPALGELGSDGGDSAVRHQRRRIGCSRPSSLSAEPRRIAPAFAAAPGRTPVYDAFISYRHSEPDKTHALDILESLERRGLRVAIDFRDFAANEHFLSEMERCIKQSRYVSA